MPHPTISKFPALARCSASIAFDWDRSYVGDLLKTLDQDGHDFGLAETELALAKLLTRFNLEDLAEQIEDLFSSDPLLSQAKWEKACTELYAFAYFEDRGLLYSLGWPPGYSDTPPFDFRAQISGTVLLCDAKPASGNGLEMVRKAIAPVIESWSVDRGIEDLQTSLDYRGTITQQALGTPLRETTALADFGVELDRHTEIPDGPLRIMLGASRIDVTLTGPGQARMSGGIQGVRPLVLSLAPTVAKHVKQKARLAAENGSVPFILVFVHLAGTGGSDAKSKHILPSAFAVVAEGLADVAAKSLWLGCVILDYRSVELPTVRSFLRTDATWPSSLTPAQFAKDIGGELIEFQASA